MTRYAIYYAPAPDSDLGRFGAAWLGRDAFTGEIIPQEEVDGLTPGRLAEITESARRYGFHATLKAPFTLAEGHSEAELIAAVDAFAATQSPFEAPALDLRSLSGYTTLVLSEPSPAMDAFAAQCVRTFDPFRAPLNAADRQRRLATPLSDRQIGYLERWGYPFVFEDFIFHLTLSNRITDPDEQAAIFEALEPVLSVIGTAPLAVDAVCLFRQPDRESPFQVIHRAMLG